MSHIIGIMIDHGDRKEYWTPELSQKDQDRIYRILEKYEDTGDWDSIEGDLDVIDLNERR